MPSRERDAATFDDLVMRHRAAVYGYLRARLTKASHAEEVTQEIFTQLYRERRRPEGDGEVRRWLLETARQALEVLVRAEHKHNSLGWTSLCLAVEQESTLPEAKTFRNVTRGLETLDPNMREALALTYSSGQSPKQIGERLRRSETAVRQLVSRAKEALRASIGGEGVSAADSESHEPSAEEQDSRGDENALPS